VSEPFSNYFNYFTEIEEHFQRARGTSLFLLSPLDWALIETWKNSGVPLEAALRGIDIAFDKWRTKKTRTQMVNSLAFCAQPVMEEARHMAETTREAPEPATVSPSPFEGGAVRKFLEENAAAIRATTVVDYVPVAESLDRIFTELGDPQNDLEVLEQKLTVLEQRLIAIARARQSEEEALAARQELERQLKPYRGRMSGPQIAMLEAQFLDRATLENARLPRLSLFYLH
jgi:hypothetical protein